MAFRFYNPNPNKLIVGDCVIRAMSLLFDDDWDTTYARVSLQGYKMKDISTLYDKVGKEIQSLNKKDSLSRDEIKAALDAICLMHKIRHFEDDGVKYGWDEDGYSQRGWTINEIPRYPYSYAGPSRGSSMSRGGSMMRGNSYEMDRYSRHDGVEEMIGRLEGLNDRERNSVLDYIDHLRG